MTVKQVRITEVKARLSEYLRAVRRRETITILNRGTPVAQIVPIREPVALRVRHATTEPIRPPKSARLTIDVVQLLLDERQADR